MKDRPRDPRLTRIISIIELCCTKHKYIFCYYTIIVKTTHCKVKYESIYPVFKRCGAFRSRNQTNINGKNLMCEGGYRKRDLTDYQSTTHFTTITIYAL